MTKDSARLIAHIGAHSDVSETYAKACRSNSGSAYGVELRTLAASHRTVANRLE